MAKLKPKKNSKDAIRHSKFNMLYLLAFVVFFFINIKLIAIPFVVTYSVDTLDESNNIDVEG